MKKAKVILRPVETSGKAKSSVQRTLSDGKFCFKDIGPGRYRLTVDRTGFVRSSYGAEDPGEAGTVIALKKGQKLERMVLTLLRAGAITGKVLDEDGDPVEGASVQALLPLEEMEERMQAEEDLSTPSMNGLQPVQLGVTNDLGEFRIAGLAPGKYVLQAEDTGGIATPYTFFSGFTLLGDQDEEEGDKQAPTYYPNTTRVEQAETIELAAGQEATADIELRHEKAVTVSGLVLRQDAGPVSGVLVRLSVPDDSVASIFSIPMAQTEADGHFTIQRVLSGSYTVHASSFSTNESLFAQQKIEIGNENVKNLRLTLSKGIAITGKIRAEGGPLPDLLQGSITLSSKDGPSDVAGAFLPDGGVKLSGLAPGTYHLVIHGMPEQYYLKRVNYGSSQSAHGLLTVASGVEPDKLELVISDRGATLEGTVQDAKQAVVGGAVVYMRLVSEDGFAFKKTAISDQNGKFLFRGLEPGKYELVPKKGHKSKSSDDPKQIMDLAEGEKKAVTLAIGQ